MLVARTGLSPVMVGRTAELSRLQSLVGASRSPTVALIAGEAGIGKTRLARELIDSLEPATVVLAGQADPGTVGRPMELFLDSLRSTDLDAHPELSAVVSDVSQPAEDRVRAGVDLVRQLTSGHTSLVVFEDLHWADSESLTLFERLAEPDGGRLLVVGTYRPDGLSRRHPAGDLLPRLERRHAVTHVRLNRLAPADVSGFLAAVFGEDPSFRTVDALHRRTGGNPFFLEELVASAGDMSTDALATAPLPWTIAELVRAQLDELDPAVRGIITAASVLGRRVSFDMLAAVTGTDEDELIALLRSAVDSGLLVEADPDSFSFHHDLAREAIRSRLLGRERRRLNEAALDVLQRSHSRDHVAMTLHAQGAERYDQMVAEARLGAHESLRLGSTYQALQLAETGLAEAEDDLELRGMATKAAWLAGLLDDAAAHGDLWLRHARAAGDISEEAAALSLRLRIAYDAGDLSEMDTFTQVLISTGGRRRHDRSAGIPVSSRRRICAFIRTTAEAGSLRFGFVLPPVAGEFGAASVASSRVELRGVHANPAVRQPRSKRRSVSGVHVGSGRRRPIATRGVAAEIAAEAAACSPRTVMRYNRRRGRPSLRAMCGILPVRAQHSGLGETVQCLVQRAVGNEFAGSFVLGDQSGEFETVEVGLIRGGPGHRDRQDRDLEGDKRSRFAAHTTIKGTYLPIVNRGDLP